MQKFAMPLYVLRIHLKAVLLGGTLHMLLEKRQHNHLFVSNKMKKHLRK